MQNVPGSENVHAASEDTSALEAEVRSRMRQGENIEQEVRDLTVKALSRQGHDQDSLRHVMGAVLKGVREGAQQKLQSSSIQAQTALSPVRDAVAGLDSALAQLAAASKLTLEEAGGRAQTFSKEELTRLRANLESIENLFFETLQESASAAQDLVEVTLRDIILHAKRNGTAVGSQLKDTLEALNHQLKSTTHSQLEAGIHLTQAITDTLRQAAANVLIEVAERVKPGDKPGGHHG
jgi:uncharacterized protein YicC (UPF0701 family)